jgi:RimJ/RimL family protein N-acetyltransferase
VRLIASPAACEFALRDATTASIRDVAAADAPQLQRFIRNLSPSSRYLRFLMAMQELPEDLLHRFTHPQQGREIVLVAMLGESDIIGMTQYVLDDDGAGCEFAIVVGDAWQRQGLGTWLLRLLMRMASVRGIRYGHADVLADNNAMRSLAVKLGCETRINVTSPYLVEIRKQFEARDTLEVPVEDSVADARRSEVIRSGPEPIWPGGQPTGSLEPSASRTDCRFLRRY